MFTISLYIFFKSNKCINRRIRIYALIPWCLVISVGTDPRLQLWSTLVDIFVEVKSSNFDRRPTGADPRLFAHPWIQYW